MTAVKVEPRSAYPVPVGELLPRARELAAELGAVPSQRKLKATLGVGMPKAKQLLELLAAEAGPALHVATEADAPAEPTAPEPPAEAEPDPVVTVDPEPAAAEEPVSPVPGSPAATGRASAWLAFTAGVGASVAANIAHSFVRPEHAAPGWHPVVGSVVAAAFWPVALLLAVEVLTRVSWPAGRWYSAARYGGLTSVAAVAAAVSYSHMSALLASWSDAWVAVHAGPVAVDGLMTMAAAALLGLSKHRRH